MPKILAHLVKCYREFWTFLKWIITVPIQVPRYIRFQTPYFVQGGWNYHTIAMQLQQILKLPSPSRSIKTCLPRAAEGLCNSAHRYLHCIAASWSNHFLITCGVMRPLQSDICSTDVGQGGELRADAWTSEPYWKVWFRGPRGMWDNLWQPRSVGDGTNTWYRGRIDYASDLVFSFRVWCISKIDSLCRCADIVFSLQEKVSSTQQRSGYQCTNRNSRN